MKTPSLLRSSFSLALLLVAACGGDAEAPAADAAMDAPEAAPAEAAEPDFVSPNDATADALAAVPGMTQAAADALVAGRPYADMLAVDAVLAQHLDEVTRETVYAGLWLPLDLNAASEEEILLIPGVGDRMAHEFEEYRPYRAMAEFHREIGKYVDETEVQRLARYVELR